MRHETRGGRRWQEVAGDRTSIVFSEFELDFKKLSRSGVCAAGTPIMVPLMVPPAGVPFWRGF